MNVLDCPPSLTRCSHSENNRQSKWRAPWPMQMEILGRSSGVRSPRWSTVFKAPARSLGIASSCWERCKSLQADRSRIREKGRDDIGPRKCKVVASPSSTRLPPPGYRSQVPVATTPSNANLAGGMSGRWCTPAPQSILHCLTSSGGLGTSDLLPSHTSPGEKLGLFKRDSRI